MSLKHWELLTKSLDFIVPAIVGFAIGIGFFIR